MMQWQQLLSAERLGKEGNEQLKNEDYARSQFQRDYDRIIFSSPFRRLQNKTQVFPLPGSIFVHNRLTHSLEVASVGRSLGSILANHLRKDEELSKLPLINEIGNIISAACLAHDLGNPAFGHSGENAISRYFTDGDGLRYEAFIEPEKWSDFTHFEGNANAFRILTHIFNGKNESQFALTYTTLATLVKYPCNSQSRNKANVYTKKYGYFASEADSYRKIAEHLGIIKFQDNPLVCYRHPLTFLVEAADDICYYIIDVEDAHRLGVFSDHEVWELMHGLLNDTSGESKVRYHNIDDSNDKISFLRAKCINSLITECSAAFIRHLPEIMDGTFNKSLTGCLPEPYQSTLKRIEKTSREKIYNYRGVVEKEIAGYRVMSGLLEEFVPAVMDGNSPYHEKLLKLIPSQFAALDDTPYSKIQSVLDFVSGMTDLYAVELFRKIKGISFPGMD